MSLAQLLQAKNVVHILRQLDRIDCDIKLLEREREREREREIQIQMVYYSQAFSPLSGVVGGKGGVIVTNAKRSTHVHILNIMDTAMLF